MTLSSFILFFYLIFYFLPDGMKVPDVANDREAGLKRRGVPTNLQQYEDSLSSSFPSSSSSLPSKQQQQQQQMSKQASWRRILLLIIAITIHNIPGQ